MKYFLGCVLCLVAGHVLAESSAPRSRKIPPPKVSLTRRSFDPPRRSQPWALGMHLALDALLGSSQGTSGTRATGMGYGVGLLGSWEVSNRVKLSLGSSFQFLKLGRQLTGGSVQLVDPNPSRFEQSVRYVGGKGMVSYRLNFYDPTMGLGEDPQWWLDGGVESLFPLSAKQSVADAEISFTAGKMVLVFLGGSLDLFLNPTYFISVNLHSYASVAGSSDNRFYGVRLAAVANLRL